MARNGNRPGIASGAALSSRFGRTYFPLAVEAGVASGVAWVGLPPRAACSVIHCSSRARRLAMSALSANSALLRTVNSLSRLS